MVKRTNRKRSLMSHGICFECGEEIESEALEALDRTYHPNCFTCYTCDTPIASYKFYVVNGKPQCGDCQAASLHKCTTCKEPIADRILTVGGHHYHPDCFVCSVCRHTISGPTFLEDDNNNVYCETDYVNKFAKTCDACQEKIRPEAGSTAMVSVTVLGKTFHPNCFACAKCGRVLTESYCEVRGRPFCGECSKAQYWFSGLWDKLSNLFKMA